MAHDIRIAHVEKLPSIDPARRGQTDTVVFFAADAGAVTSVTIHKDTSNIEEIKSAIKKELELRASIIGQKFTLP